MKKYEKITSFLLYILAAIGILTMLFTATNKYIWADEAFSLKLIRHSYQEVIRLTAQDVHPPLYYILLKFFVQIGDWLNISDKSMGSILSSIPTLILMVISLTMIRKRWGLFASSIFIFCITFMSNCLTYGTEIRMYSLGMLFVTLTYIVAYEIILHRRLRDWLLLLVFGLGAAYTHYFACIPVAIIYGYLLLWTIIKDRAQLKKWLLISLATFMLYLPWLVIVLKQVSQVNGAYWIGDITIDTIKWYIQYILSVNNKSLSTLIEISYICVLVKLILDKNKTTEEKIYTFMGCLVPVLTILIGVVVSWLMRPIFVERYILPSLGCFWLCFAIGMSSLRLNKIGSPLILLLLLCLGGINYKSYLTLEKHQNDAMNKVNRVIDEQINEETVVLTDSDHIQATLAYYLPQKIYIFSSNTSDYAQSVNELMKKVYTNTDNIDTQLLMKELLNGKTILYWDTGGKDELYNKLEELSNGRINFTYIDGVNIATLTASLYKIELNVTP